ncbi:MAG: hypothetical protein AB8I08_27680 [Sandaracinaceae bacterium]
MTNLSDDGVLPAIDNEEVAHQDRGDGATFTVFARSRHDVEVRFPVVSALLTSVRVWGHDLPLPSAEEPPPPRPGCPTPLRARPACPQWARERGAPRG